MKLKRLLLIAPLTLVLVGCTKNDQQKKVETSSSAKTSIYVVKNDNNKKKKAEKKSKSGKDTNGSKDSESGTSNQGKAEASGNSSLPPSDGTLTDFVNRYGMSPSAWLQKHGGLTQQQALEQVPRGMKSSGEIQTENAYHGIGVGNTSSTSLNNTLIGKETTNNASSDQIYHSTPAQPASQANSVPAEVAPVIINK